MTANAAPAAAALARTELKLAGLRRMSAPWLVRLANGTLVATPMSASGRSGVGESACWPALAGRQEMEPNSGGTPGPVTTIFKPPSGMSVGVVVSRLNVVSG